MKENLLERLLCRPGVAELLRQLGNVLVLTPAGGVLLDCGVVDVPAGDAARPVCFDGRELGRVAGANAELGASLLAHLAREGEMALTARQEEDELREVLLALSSELNLERLLCRIMEAASRLLNADRATLFLHDADKGELWAPVALGEQGGSIRIPEDRGIAGQVFASGVPVNIEDAYRDERFDPQTDRRTGYRTRSLLCCPVVNKQGRVIGVIQALNRHGGPFTGRDQTRLLGFAAQASIAIENARLYHQMEELVRERTRELDDALARLSGELEAAARYVRRLLPAPLDHGEVCCSWRYVPCHSLGGDAFGYRWIDDDHFAIYLNDVSGHGVDAALLSVSVMNVLESEMISGVDPRDPGQVLSALNNAFPMDRHGNMFFTMWYGVWRPSRSELVFSSGGHPPALLLRHGECLRLGVPNLLLGCRADQEYESAAQTIRPGDRLLVYSDGVYEIEKREGGMWTLDRFARYMAEPGSSGAGHPTLDQLMDHTRSMSGRDGWEDDFSIVEARFG